MRLSVIGDRIRLRGELRELVTRRLYFALGRLSGNRSGNGPGGGMPMGLAGGPINDAGSW